MSENTALSIDRLSPSWVRRSLSRKKPKRQNSDSGPTTSTERPDRPSLRSSTSDDSRLSTSGSHTSLRGIVNRIRSPSNASSTSRPTTPSSELEFKEIEDWFYGFQKYNQLLTTKAPTTRTTPSDEISRATKLLTKNCGGQFLHELPEAAFDFALLWCPTGPHTKANPDEPSWSWTASHGPISFPFDPTNCPDIYTIPRSEGEWFRSEIVQFHTGPVAAPYTVRREKSNQLRIKYPPYFHAPRGYDASAESRTLRFTTSAVSAEGFATEQLHYKGVEIPCSQLLDEEARQCGVIMDFEAAISEPSSTGPFEFVLLSRSLRREATPQTRRPTVATMHPPGTPIWDGERFVWDEEVVDFDDDVFENGPWKMLNVMLIKWVGGHAERVAIARIHEDAWKQRGPVRKEIVLR